MGANRSRVRRAIMADRDRLLGGYDPNAGRSAHVASRPTLIPVPSLLRALLSEHLDPGYAAAAAKRAAVAQARSVAPGVRTAQQLLVRNVRSTEAAATGLAQRRGALATRVDEVQRLALTDDAEGQRLLGRLDALSLAAASRPIIGPGLTVTVTDPGAGPNLSDVSKQRVNGSRQIILDRDLQLVVNSLWASGAEAVSVGGVRIGPDVTIRQAGGAILVDNTPTGSPYAILAVGPPNAMRDAFDRSAGLQRLRLLEVSYGVGVTVNVSDGLSLPAGSVRELKFAKPIGPQ
ncbi:membrane associated protein [Mycobacterium bohemicum DSM 44277]|uniref:Membrane associated protein n=2 Tax=Mycobacterium bohemicum TaxID=56425 RepID=A0A0U0W3V2_MYCBE|nr:membrane associated protein [Mycobacterium bohemicum DSM 44277]